MIQERAAEAGSKMIEEKSIEFIEGNRPVLDKV